MPDRYLVQEVVELGVESVPGTPVPATLKLAGLNIDLDTALEVDRFAPMGNLWDTVVAPRQESGTGALSGFPTYPELPYVFSNVFGAGTTTTPSGAVTAHQYYWKPSSTVPWTPKTWTVRRGQVGNTAEMAAYALMSGVRMSFSRTATPEIGGDLFSYALDYAASVGASGAVAKPVVPVLPADVCVYLDPTFAAIGTTKLTRAFMVGIDISGLFGPVWPLDCALDSFASHAVLKPDAGATLQMGNDVQGRDPVTAMRAGDVRYLRIEATGPQIDAGPPAYSHRLRIDAALKVVSAPARGDSDGLSTLEWSFALVDDPSFGGALAITVVTNVASL